MINPLVSLQTLQIPIEVDWKSVVSGAAGGLIVFLVSLIAEFLVRQWEKSREKSEQQIVRFKNETRKITGAIFTYLGPDASVEMMKSDLGPPNKQYGTDAGLFTLKESEEASFPVEENAEYVPRFTAYLYFFQNGQVKIISENRESIVALTVMATDESISMPFSETEFINECKVDESFFEDSDVVAEHMPGCRDTVTAICSSRSFPGIQIATTYFCHAYDKDFHDADLENNPRELIGAIVHGVCISKGIENVSYIYLSELA